MDKASPIHKTTDFQLSDEIRLARKRSPDDFKTILNFSNSLADGLRVRRGYAPYTDIVWPVVGGVSLNASSLNVPLVCGIDVPSKTDVHFLCMASDPQVWMYPNWLSSTKQNASIPLAESFFEALIPGNPLFNFPDVSFPTVVTMKVIGWTTHYSHITTNNYFKGWRVTNVTKSRYTIVKSSSYDVGTDSMTFTFTDNIDAAGMNWATNDVFKFYRSYHDNVSFIPTYNVDLTNPPCAVADNSILFFSGGQGSDTNLKGSIIYPRMNKTFLPGITGGGFDRSWTVDGTYASEERCKPYDILSSCQFANSTVDSSKYLDGGATYWIGIAPIYDGGNIGELQRYETPSFYSSSLGTQNFIATGSTNTVLPTLQIRINAGTLNKTINAFGIWVAKDLADTRTSGRQTPYFFVGQISVVGGVTDVDTEGLGGSNWAWAGGANGGFGFTFYVTKPMMTVALAANTYETDSGMTEIQSDTSYAYSGRKVVGGRHFLYNTYVTSTGVNDRQNLFTNPTGQNASINSGIPQRRLFPNEEDYYKIHVVPDIGTRINAVIPKGFDEFIILKERGVISSRIVNTNDLIPELISNVIDHKIGCSTFNGYAVSNQEQIYFAGYDDCYVFNAGQLRPLIERGDKRDWLYTYREVLTNTQKENVVVIWLPQSFLIWDFGQQPGTQFTLDSGGWSQAAFNQSSGLTSTEFFKFPFKLNNGSVIALGTVAGGVAGAYGPRQFQNPTTGAFYSTDAGVAIKYQLDTDYFNFGHDQDFVLNKVIFNRSFNSTPSGQLDVALYRDRVLVRVYTLDLTKYRTFMHSKVGDPKIGFEWRFIYNNNTSPEIASSSQYQIDSIEIYGEKRSRSKRATEVTTVTNVAVWNVDTWDGGKSYGA